MTTYIATLLCVYAGDSPELFREALDSILDQQLGSTIRSRIYLGIDGPIQVELNQAIDHYADRLHLVYRSTANSGLAVTLNELLHRLDNEEFIFRMDADDVSLPIRYQTQLEYLMIHPKIDILGTGIMEVNLADGTEREVRFCVSSQDAASNIHRRVPVAHPTVCFRRRVFQEISGYPTVGTNEDIALWFECIRHGFSFDNVPQTLLRFRISPAFWKRRSLKKARSEFLCYVRGIRSLHGVCTIRYVFPLIRLIFRLAPTFVSKWAYGSSFRVRSKSR